MTQMMFDCMLSSTISVWYERRRKGASWESAMCVPASFADCRLSVELSMRSPVSFEFFRVNQGYLLRGVLFSHVRRRSLAPLVSFKVEGASEGSADLR
jgi:hypothetical protein